jgi:hypothetical protein
MAEAENCSGVRSVDEQVLKRQRSAMSEGKKDY